jgi:hypothetical protein
MGSKGNPHLRYGCTMATASALFLQGDSWNNLCTKEHTQYLHQLSVNVTATFLQPMTVTLLQFS